MNLRHLVGKFMKVHELHMALQGTVSIDEIKMLMEFLSSKKQGQSIDPDEAAVTDVGSDRIDMDDLIEAVRLKAEIEFREPAQ